MNVFKQGLLAVLLMPLGNTALAAEEAAHPQVRMETNRGDIVIDLYQDKAPKSVANFLQYARDDHYDGTLFHRVIPDFMIQGGGFNRDLERKPTRQPIDNEADNGLHNERGTVAMARTRQPDSATSQFFINLADNDFLDFQAPTRRGHGYAVFGRVVKGMDVVDRISQIPTGASGPFDKDVPQEPVVIENVIIVRPPQEGT